MTDDTTLAESAISTEIEAPYLEECLKRVLHAIKLLEVHSKVIHLDTINDELSTGGRPDYNVVIIERVIEMLLEKGLIKNMGTTEHINLRST